MSSAVSRARKKQNNKATRAVSQQPSKAQSTPRNKPSQQPQREAKAEGKKKQQQVVGQRGRGDATAARLALALLGRLVSVQALLLCVLDCLGWEDIAAFQETGRLVQRAMLNGTTWQRLLSRHWAPHAQRIAGHKEARHKTRLARLSWQ